MNILEDQEEDNLPTLYPQHLSVRINKWHHADTGTESEESFDIRVDEDSDLDSPSESDKATEAKLKVGVLSRTYLGGRSSTCGSQKKQRYKTCGNAQRRYWQYGSQKSWRRKPFA